MGPDGGKVSLIHDTRCRATFPKHALHKKIKVGLQVQTLSSELVQAAFGRSVEVSKIVAVEPRKRKFHQPFFVSIPLPCSGSKINSSTDIRLICSVTGSLDPVSWVDMTGSTPLEVNKDVVHFSTKVSALFWILLIHDNTRDPSSALTLATRLYEETRLGNYNIYSSTLDFTISSYVWDFKTSLFAAGFAFKPAQHFYSGFHCFSVTSSFCLYRVIACFCGSKLPLFSILTVEWFYKHIFLSLSQHFFLPVQTTVYFKVHILFYMLQFIYTPGSSFILVNSSFTPGSRLCQLTPPLLQVPVYLS
ncbi:uncharacterized protein LOC111706864 [Eurytemora carolleeae]|uniref:uncharacterized protein LOC111706864 n=1 Tax=Eurytemora carolleeae TaxID=1294199 RepID=UPI000C79414B|nr:uncharacterized protein LOC111706864 [Eurytemora carolleeae]|eukprot:XP_023335565.1 uncharacterized protein LOC111706864 [Eurytemora affinis]